MNMKALVSSIEPRENGYRIAQVEPDNNTFPVAEGLFWVNCQDDCVADQFWYDPQDKTIKPTPEQNATVESINMDGVIQPTVSGAETL